MSRYINEICAGCGLPIKADDDVVVCPECATPQHRECYAKNHACVNEEKHGSDFVWQPQRVLTEPKAEAGDRSPCPICGFENKKESRFCNRCGEPLLKENEQKDENGKADFITENFSDDEELLSESDRKQVEDLLTERSKRSAPGMSKEQEKEQLIGHPIKTVLTFICEKSLYYGVKFQAMERGKKFTWNWAAFLFSPFWFFYRKMYKTGIVFLTIRTCISMLLSAPLTNIASIYSSLTAESLSSMTEEAMAELMSQMMPNLIPIYIGFAVMVVLALISGFAGNRLYMKKVKSRLDELSASKSKDEYLINFIKYSAVNPIAVVIAYTAATFLPNIILSFFM